MKNVLNSSTEFSHTKQIIAILSKSKQMFKANQWETLTTAPPLKILILYLVSPITRNYTKYKIIKQFYT